MTMLSIFYILSSFVLICGATFIYNGNRRSSKHRAFGLAFVLMAGWQQSAMLINLLPSDQSKYVFMYGLVPFMFASFMVLLHAVYHIAGVYTLKQAVFFKLLFIPPVLNLLLVPVEGWLYRGDLLMYSGQHPTPGPGTYTFMGILFIYIIVIVALLIPLAKRKHRPSQIWMGGMAFSMLWVLAIVVFGELTGMNESFTLVPLGIDFWAAAMFISVYKYDSLPSYERRYSVLFEKAPIGILITDNQAMIQEASPRLAEYLKVPVKQLIGQSLLHWVDEQERERQYGIYLDHFHKRRAFQQYEITVRDRNHQIKFLSLSSDFIEMEGQAFKLMMLNDITESKQRQRQIHELAYFDQLTGLHNRASFQLAFEEWIKHKQSFTLIILDLDKFKNINDRFGHLAGDQALKDFASKLRASVQQEDFVGRLSGDEFVIMVSDISQVDAIIQSVQTRLKEPFEPLPGQQLVLSASIGSSTYPIDGEALDALFREADSRMYLNKTLFSLIMLLLMGKCIIKFIFSPEGTIPLI